MDRELWRITATGPTVTAIASAIMVGSADLCLGSAVHVRRLLGIIAATVMLCSMIDLAYFNLFPSVFWAGFLFIAAILLGFDLRIGSPDKTHHISLVGTRARELQGSRKAGSTEQ